MIRSGSVLIGMLISGLAWTSVSGGYPYFSCFEVASRLHDVPLDMLLAVATTESNMDPDARSEANAHGIMQIQWPGTARHLGVKRVSELYNPCLNIELGARYLRQLMDDNGGNVERSLAAYNYGPTRIAALRELPDGASKYVAIVNGHRKRINATAMRHAVSAVDRSPRVSELVRFDSSLRARRYARFLVARVSNAEFATQRVADGSYAVIMNVKDGGLSMGDLSALEMLGWPAPGQNTASGDD
jgi:membrane-bound lytic murein transglycosylase MltF